MDPQRDDLAASLPRPRDDEPASLRQDIIDELQDHLQCAARREQFAGAIDDQTAWQRARDQFGDPQAMARKLYWQAMWRRVMQQRILVASCVAMLLLCGSLAAAVWVMMERQQQSLADQRAWTERQQANLESLLNRQSASSEQYGFLRLQLARPMYVKLSGGSLASTIELGGRMSEDPKWPDADHPGEYEFGELNPGFYELSLSGGSWSHSQQILIRRGQTSRPEIVLPPDGSADVTITTNLPDSFPIDFDAVIGPASDSFGGRKWDFGSLETISIGQSQQLETRVWWSGPVRLVVGYNPAIRRFERGRWLPSSWEHASTATKTDDPDGSQMIYQVFEVHLQPGPNTWHIEFPAEWTAVAEQIAEQDFAGIRTTIDDLLKSRKSLDGNVRENFRKPKGEAGSSDADALCFVGVQNRHREGPDSPTAISEAIAAGIRASNDVVLLDDSETEKLVEQSDLRKPDSLNWDDDLGPGRGSKLLRTLARNEVSVRYFLFATVNSSDESRFAGKYKLTLYLIDNHSAGRIVKTALLNKIR